MNPAGQVPVEHRKAEISAFGSLDAALYRMNSSTKRANASGCSQHEVPAPCSVISSKPAVKNFSCPSNIFARQCVAFSCRLSHHPLGPAGFCASGIVLHQSHTGTLLMG